MLETAPFWWGSSSVNDVLFATLNTCWSSPLITIISPTETSLTKSVPTPVTTLVFAVTFIAPVNVDWNVFDEVQTETFKELPKAPG